MKLPFGASAFLLSWQELSSRQETWSLPSWALLRHGLKEDQVLYLSYSIKFIYQEVYKISRKSGPYNCFQHSNCVYFIFTLHWNLVQFSCSVMSDSLQSHGLLYVRPPCPSPTPRVYPNSCPLSQYPNSCPLSQWCHPTISNSVGSFSPHLQSFPATESFQMSQFCTSGGQSIGVSASTSVLPTNTHDFIL